jgi:hypothetical protein
MPQKMPVIRQIHWPGLIPQFIMIAAFAMAIHFFWPRTAWDKSVFLSWDRAFFCAALAYLIMCRVLRAVFTRHHIAGMRAYHACRFEEAISHFQASYQFFSAHRLLDACRAWVLGVASANSYLAIALCNMAFCHSQAGRGAKAIELYEQALSESPGFMTASASLRALRSMSPTENAPKAT